MDSLLVKDYMVPDLEPVTSDMNTSQAVDLLLSNQLSGAPVIDERHRVIGFLSEKDCIKHLINTSYYRDAAPSVLEIMNPDVVSVTPETGILEVAEMMLEHAPKVYPVCQDKLLVGIIPRENVLHALREGQEPAPQ